VIDYGCVLLHCMSLILCRFSAAGNEISTHGPPAGGRKAPRHEIAPRSSAWAVRQGAVEQEPYGDLGSGQQLRVRRATRRRCNLDVTARMLLNRDFTFCPMCDFNRLRLPWSPHLQLLRDKPRDGPWPTA
jgi:hypothetical protein